MSKESLIHRITLIDTGAFRRDTEGNLYRHEPPKFRSTLFDIYNKLSEEDLKTLINTRNNGRL
tara:strand:+ start:263 stop:451 length:189 start_codon:yes stop_codon:yes gene_type:complete